MTIQMLRNYKDAQDSVKEHYKKMRSRQTIGHVLAMANKYNHVSKPMTVWEAIDSLGGYVDVSDPDVTLPNNSHLFQTAEGIRKDGHPDWMQLVGLIHDMGKCLYLRGCDTDGTTVNEQWSIVGDTFIVGVPLSDKLVYPEFKALNPDHDKDIYKPGIGLNNCLISYGHDEYLYQVLLQTPGVSIPIPGLYMIRFHSLYPWHKKGQYTELEDDQDRAMKKWVQLFNKYDLYTKCNTPYTKDKLTELRAYYDTLIKKYLPEKLLF